MPTVTTESTTTVATVTGKWTDVPVEVGSGNAKELIEEFANCKEGPEAILRFTRKFGPLETAHRTNADGKGAFFQFSVPAWRKEQHRIQMEWEAYFEFRHIPISVTAIATSPKEYFVLTQSGLKYRAENLLRLLSFSLTSIPAERLRVCVRPHCTHPYFIARHLNQNYCSDRCARYGQQKWKKDWWDRHGTEWRRKRKAVTAAAGKKPSRKEK